MRKISSLGVFVFLSIVLIFLCSLFSKDGKSPLSSLSQSVFENLFQNETAREIFDLEQEEAKEVFGWESETVFL